MKILITGSKGLLAQELIKVFGINNNLILIDREELDLTDFDLIKEFILKNKPDMIINTAAYTQVDFAEKLENQTLVMKINAEAVKNLAEISAENNIKLVQYSTDYVFSGKKEIGYREEDIKGESVNFYGKTKSLAEDAILELSKQYPEFEYYILRTSWLYGKGGKNFVETMLNLAKIKSELSIVSDQIGSPTYALDVARQTRYLLDNNYQKGIYHLTNSGYTSWYEFAQEIFRLKEVKIKLSKVSSIEYPTLAKRPNFSILLNTKIDYKMRDWKEALIDYLK